MKFFKFIIILPLLWWGFDARAQLSQEGLSSTASMPEQWQLTLDGIKSKAQSLVIENNGLQDEYRQLIEEVQKLQQSIRDLQYKNEQLEDFLKQRRGRTDQQVRIEELTQMVKAKNQEARDEEEQLGDLNRKQSALDQRIQQLKYTISDIELHQQAQKQKAMVPPSPVQPQADDQLGQLRKQLEDQKTQEVFLENELEGFKTGGKSENLNVDALDSENKQLEARLDMLRLQKLQQEKKSSDVQLSQASARMYDKLRMQKEELEAKIYAYEMRMDSLRQSSLMALSWPIKKKKLVHEMVLVDARNNQMRAGIKVLREDIEVLRDQVAKLERRVDFDQNKEVTFTSVP